MLQPATLQFLRDIRDNNQREWYHAHKKEYKIAKADFEKAIGEILTVLVQHDEDMMGLRPKDCTFRLFRDVRFSKDKRPYKTNMGAAMARGGRKSWWPGYYIHLEPDGRSFVGGGLYRPPSALLKAVRQEIDYNQSAFKAILDAPAFQQYYGKLSGDTLQRAPKGYNNDHPALSWLKHKDFLGIHPVDDAVWTSKEAVAYVSKALLALQPLKRFLSQPMYDEEVLEALQPTQ